MSTPLALRPAAAADMPAIREINRIVFRMEKPGPFEKLVEQGAAGVLARVAVNAAGEIAGHIIFAPAAISAPERDIEGMGLGELAIHPECQRRGIGTQLMVSGLAVLDAAGCPYCIVVGHASYYPRFGFERGSLHGLRCQWPRVPDASFMVRVCDKEALRGLHGVVARFTGL